MIKYNGNIKDAANRNREDCPARGLQFPNNRRRGAHQVRNKPVKFTTNLTNPHRLHSIMPTVTQLGITNNRSGNIFNFAAT